MYKSLVFSVTQKPRLLLHTLKVLPLANSHNWRCVKVCALEGKAVCYGGQEVGAYLEHLCGI